MKHRHYMMGVLLVSWMLLACICPPQPPAGPDIIVGVSSVDSSKLEWRVDGSVQSVATVSGTPVSLFATDGCKLRGDFIGLRKNEFDVTPSLSSGTKFDATRVTASNANYEVEFGLVGYRVLRWKIKDLTTGDVCIPAVWEGAPAGIPQELDGLDFSSLVEETQGTVEEAHLQVEMPD